MPDWAESRPRPLRGAARADERRRCRRDGVDPARAGGFHGHRPWHPASESATEMQLVQRKRKTTNCQSCFLLQMTAPEGALQA